MDFAQLQMKFGADTKWCVAYRCAWCSQPLQNQTEEKHRERGNCCPACNTKYAQNAFNNHPEREVTATDRLIRQTRMEMDTLALRLEEPISETERLEVVENMKRKFVKIKILKAD
jgi:DNA-directed RNA polymerase subunit RPC12/RpoP